MADYQVGSAPLSTDDPGFDQALARAYEQRQDVFCLCKAKPLPMYLAKVGSRHIVKRMPNTGPLHAFDCDHYDAPPTLSGLGDVMGSAIQDTEDGHIGLKLSVSLSRTGPRIAPLGQGDPQDSVKSDATKLSLLGLLHYLWHEAELHRWLPSFSGKRNWYVVRKRLLAAMLHKNVKKHPLSDRLYMPESWSKEHAAEIDRRRRAFLTNFRSTGGSKRELFIIIGELKSIEASRYGWKASIKHAPGFPVFFNEDVLKGLNKHFGTELAMAEAYEDRGHLMVIMTASLNKANVASLEDVSLMFVDDNWIPIETSDEHDLIHELTQSKRRYVKGLRFNVRHRPIATAMLTDTDPPVAMFIVPPDAEDSYQAMIDELSQESATATWCWNVADGEWPLIPAPASVDA